MNLNSDQDYILMDINKYLNAGIQSDYVFVLPCVGVRLASKLIAQGSVNPNTTDGGPIK